MLKKERQERILQTVSDKRYCTVNTLSKTLYVAPITIRRDLEEMEKAGLLKRCHGGAAIEDHRNREVPFELRDRENAEAKIRIAQKAAKLLKEGDTVFLDASSTVSHIADFITPDLELTIITNSVYVLEKLRGKQIRCYLLPRLTHRTLRFLIGNHMLSLVSRR